MYSDIINLLEPFYKVKRRIFVSNFSQNENIFVNELFIHFDKNILILRKSWEKIQLFSKENHDFRQ